MRMNCGMTVTWGDHERVQVQEEEQIAPPEPQAGEGVGSKGRGHRLEDGDAPDHDQAVYQVPAERGEVPGRREVLGMPLPRPPCRRVGGYLRCRLERCQDHPDDRDERKESHRHEGSVDEYRPVHLAAWCLAALTFEECADRVKQAHTSS